MRVYAPSSFFSSDDVSTQVTDPYTSTDSAAARKKFLFNLSVRLDFQMAFILFMAAHAFAIRILTSRSVEPM